MSTITTVPRLKAGARRPELVALLEVFDRLPANTFRMPPTASFAPPGHDEGRFLDLFDKDHLPLGEDAHPISCAITEDQLCRLRMWWAPNGDTRKRTHRVTVRPPGPRKVNGIARNAAVALPPTAPSVMTRITVPVFSYAAQKDWARKRPHAGRSHHPGRIPKMTVTPERITSEAAVREEARKRAASLDYSTGFGNEHASEALVGALPVGRNSPQRPAYGMYTELLSATAFTELRHNTRRTWLYHIRPSKVAPRFERVANGTLLAPPFTEIAVEPNILYWAPRPPPAAGTDFVSGLRTLGGNGDPALAFIARQPNTRCRVTRVMRFPGNAKRNVLP